MFKGRVNQFVCDDPDCGHAVAVPGFPYGWVHFQDGMKPVQHLCEICKHKDAHKNKKLQTAGGSTIPAGKVKV